MFPFKHRKISDLLSLEISYDLIFACNYSEDEFIIQVTLGFITCIYTPRKSVVSEKKSLVKYLTDCSSNK